MRVKIIDVAANGTETFRCTSRLEEIFPERDGEYDHAHDQIDRFGRAWIGGGAAPLTLLMREH
jgi:hypothetical protein